MIASLFNYHKYTVLKSDDELKKRESGHNAPVIQHSRILSGSVFATLDISVQFKLFKQFDSI